MKKSRSSPSHLQHLDDSDDEDGAVHTDVYHSLSIQVCGGTVISQCVGAPVCLCPFMCSCKRKTNQRRFKIGQKDDVYLL